MARKFTAFSVSAVDTTAAGDTFCGSLTAFMAEGKSIQEAIILASAASALTVQKLGAYPSIPNKNEIESFLVKRK